MKNLLASWLIIQLVLIGVLANSTLQRINDGTYECNPKPEKPSFALLAIPLVLFVPEMKEVELYCKEKDLQSQKF